MNTIAIIRTHNSAWIINETIGRVQQCVDGIIIHDDGSTDNTVELCKQYHKVLDVIEDKKGYYHEGMDLAILLNQARKYNPKNVLQLDDDEVLPFITIQKILDLTSKPLEYMYAFPLLYFWGNKQDIRVDPPWNYQFRTRLVPNRADLYITYKECHCAMSCGLPTFAMYFPIEHYGYCSEELIKDKQKRYENFGEKINQLTDEELRRSFEDNKQIASFSDVMKQAEKKKNEMWLI